MQQGFVRNVDPSRSWRSGLHLSVTQDWRCILIQLHRQKKVLVQEEGGAAATSAAQSCPKALQWWRTEEGNEWNKAIVVGNMAAGESENYISRRGQNKLDFPSCELLERSVCVCVHCRQTVVCLSPCVVLWKIHFHCVSGQLCVYILCHGIFACCIDRLCVRVCVCVFMWKILNRADGCRVAVESIFKRKTFQQCICMCLL